MDDRPLSGREELVGVRRQLLAGNVSPPGAADGVAASWQRVQRAGLSPELCAADAVLDAAALQLVVAENERLIAFALPELENLHQQIAGSGSAVLLADAHGVILERQGDPRFRERSQQVALSPGACWGEGARGTNAIGVALAEGRCASVHGPEHFLECNTFLTCAATPIHDPAGGIIGLLDVSGDQPARQLHALGLVRMGARMIENRMLAAEFPAAIYLHFHARPELLGTLGEGIAAVDGDGRLLALNAVARSHFANLAPGTGFEALFEGSLEQLLRGDSISQMIRTTTGITVCVRVIKPQQHATARSVYLADTGQARSQDPFSELHAGDPAVAETLQRAQRVFARGIPLLIEGETGTGKEWAARALHARGPRSDGPLVTVNCAAIPEGLAEAELFGYVPGAFTGASASGADGRVMEANGGTLFLDEIGDMPLALQTRLLRVIQERSVLPVGGGAPREVDFSLISATNCDLAAMVAEGRFRADLYYRLCGLRIQLPPLRSRADLAGLIDRFIADEDPQAPLSATARERLLGHHWPGNLRELHNVLRTAIALREPGRPIDIADLPETLMVNAAPAPLDVGDASDDLRAAERRCMEAAVEAHDGNYSAAARSLGISRSTLYRRLGRGDNG